MTKKTCKTCAWRVFENPEKIGDYIHKRETAEHCFCLTKDLFTDAESEDDACSDYCNDGEGNK